MRLSLLLIGLSLILNVSCANLEIADIGPIVQLPASKDCYKVTVISRIKTRIPAEQCEHIRQRAIFITSEDWKKQRISIQKNCQFKECKQLVGAFDDLFLTIDGALDKIPLP